jgi:Tfp pilus assembly protein PilV
MMKPGSEKGTSLIEVMMALGVMTVGMLGAVGVLAQGMEKLASSPGDVLTTQKASELIEAVYSARDSHKLTWSQIKNVHGASGSDNGVFLDGPQQIKLTGLDGIANTADDTTVETTLLPGPDQVIGTSDDQYASLANYTREVTIRDVTGEAGALRTVVVTVTYRAGSTVRTYTLKTYISNYS